jgi:hypothetical protein
MAAGSRSVQVNLFQNDTFEPRLTEAIGYSLRRQLQQDGTFSLATDGSGDVVVSGVITKFDRSGLSYNKQDILTIRDYDMTVYAHVTAVDRATGRTVLDKFVSGRTSVRAGADLPSTERQALPLLAEDLSRNVTSLLVDGTW